MKNIIAAIVSVLLGFGIAWSSPVTVETNWIYDLLYQKCAAATTCAVDVAGIGVSVGHSAGNDVVGLSYAISPVGGNATFTIAQTTSPYNSATGVPSISTTSAITVLDGTNLNGEFKALTTNPVFYFTGLSVATTVHVWVEHGHSKNR